MKVPSKQVEIFCGTGGVGKTTLATSRALFLAENNKKVLLITIDPAKRLKQILNIDDDDSGNLNKISLEIFKGIPEKSFDALLLSPNNTLKRIGKEKGLEQEFDNRIFNILTKPHGGMNEIMAIVEVQHHLEKNEYDTIILDTPPGKHFLDFLKASNKISHFFDKSFIEIFQLVGKKVTHGTPTKKLFLKIVSTGIKKLLSYLEKVTGKEFVSDFIEAINLLYNGKDVFLRSLSFQEELKKESFSNWFLVSSADQYKVDEAKELKISVCQTMHSNNYILVNKSLSKYVEEWKINDSDPLFALKNSITSRENRVKEFAEKNFNKMLIFTEVLGSGPLEHVKELASNWE